MKRLNFILIVSVVLLSVSCGQQHQANSLVDDFMEANLKDPSAISDKVYGKIDSTNFISDSMITDMRAKAKNMQLYKNNIRYTNGKLPEMYYFVKVTFNTPLANGKKKKNRQTFYFDKNMTYIIAFK